MSLSNHIYFQLFSKLQLTIEAIHIQYMWEIEVLVLPLLPQGQTESHSFPAPAVYGPSPTHEWFSPPHQVARWGQKSPLCLKVVVFNWLFGPCNVYVLPAKTCSLIHYPEDSCSLASQSPGGLGILRRSFLIWRAQCSKTLLPSESSPTHTGTPHISVSTQTRPRHWDTSCLILSSSTLSPQMSKCAHFETPVVHKNANWIM